MKRSLFFHRFYVSVLLLCYFINTNGQTVVFSEDFSGFTQGYHANPYSNEVTFELDSRTHLPGWTGVKVYSAGGEIKLGNADITGWIETPLITLSGYEGTLILKFDICRYSNDATDVKVLLNAQQIGNNISPTTDFQTIEIPLTSGVSSGKIKFEAISKRFYLDNIFIVSQNTTTAGNPLKETGNVLIFPNPAVDFVTVEHGGEYEILEVLDLNGRIYITKLLTGIEKTDLSLSDFPSGIYILKLSSGKKLFTGRLIKLQ